MRRWLARFSGLTWRLSALYVAGVTLLLFAVLTGVYLYTSSYLTAESQRTLTGRANSSAAYLELAVRPLGEPSDELLRGLAPLLATGREEEVVRLYSYIGNTLYNSRPSFGEVPSSGANDFMTQQGLGQIYEYNNPNYLYAAAPVRYEGRVVAVVEVAMAQTASQDFLALLARIFGVALLAALLLSVLASLVLARYVSRPIIRVAGVAAAIATGSEQGLAARAIAEARRPDEIGRLAADLNAMAERLQSLLAARNTFVRSMAHELRTPLTTIKGYIINLQDDDIDEQQRRDLQVVEAECDRLVRLVNELLDFARSEANLPGVPLVRQELDFAALVREVGGSQRLRAERLGLRLVLSLPSNPLMVQADPDRLKQIVINLLDNALKYSPVGGKVEVSLNSMAGCAELRIANEGLGLTEQEREAVFQPYYRGQAAGDTDGLGLGLPIARQLAQAQGGSLTLQAAGECGTVAVLRLPL